MQAEVGARPAGGQDQLSVADVPEAEEINDAVTWCVWPTKTKNLAPKQNIAGSEKRVFRRWRCVFSELRFPLLRGLNLNKKTAELRGTVTNGRIQPFLYVDH